MTAVLLSVAGLTATGGWAAGLRATATGTSTVSSGGWGLVATQASGTPTPGPLKLTYLVPVLGGPPAQYFSVVNTGTVTVTGAGYKVAVAGGGLLAATAITLTACVGASWNSAAGTCSGTKQVLGTWSSSVTGSVTSTVVPAAPGGSLSLQAAVSGSGIVGGQITATISTTVSASSPRQIRVATSRIA